ncbi:hypothetical protein G7085_05130 [Tessaracoccus sp. HDW20]|uniref:metallophosphoesterase n=1 Tax=Tessaracoccus coleopterorum TaxID=2714950 RepID=UPI0018D2CA14|nr:metallophosphoesterase [Tessaracoccus coleopterorum]NHB84213.1 hypothetical protein [Tessaracoccus coleopterorum]
MRTIRTMAPALLLVVVTAAPVAPPSASAAGPDCSDFTVSLAALRDPDTGATLLTQFGREIRSAVERGFDVVDPTRMTVSSEAGPGRLGVWRLYSPGSGDFTWAAEGADLQAAEAMGYRAQFLQFYASAGPLPCTEPVARLGLGPRTELAVGDAERDALLGAGWDVQASAAFHIGTGAGRPATGPPPPTSAANESFTVAVIPDTQQETWNDSDTRFAERSAWLVNNAAKLNLKYVTHVGDVVDWGNVAPEQYTRAQKGLAPLKGKVPYSLTLGNHDTGAVCQGGSACPGISTNVAVRDTTAFNKAFP